MIVRISSKLHMLLRALAARRPDEEVCGLLFGTADEITGIEQTDNISSSLNDSFEIDPTKLIAAHRRVRAGGPTIIGCFHSHPGGRPTPSERDAQSAAPDGQYWLIIGDDVGLWRAVACGRVHARFDRVDYLVDD